MSGPIVRVDIPDAPASIVRFVGLAEIVKSTMVTVMVGVVWERGPLTPATVMLYVPAVVAFTVTVEVPEPTIL